MFENGYRVARVVINISDVLVLLWLSDKDK